MNVLPDLIKTTELFLVPSSFLVAALGTADTNLHWAAVSLLGLAVSVFWQVCTREALVEAIPTQPDLIKSARFRILVWFPMLFIVGWLASLIIHLLLSGQGLGNAA